MGCGSSRISCKKPLKVKSESNFTILRSKALFTRKVLFIIREVSPETEVSRINEFESK